MLPYASYDFYKGVFYGDTLTQENAVKWLDRASDVVDHITFHRLRSAFPEAIDHAVKIRKGVCAIADALCLIDEQSKAASAQKAADGTYRGAVASVSSGRESISFAVGGAAGASVYAVAAASPEARMKLIFDIACTYFANVPDANGTNLLYAGGEQRV